MQRNVIQTAAAMLPALREARRKRKPAGELYSVPVRSGDGVDLSCTMISKDPSRAIVVAHPAVVGSRYRQVVSLADELSRSYSVLSFDFRGHGRSGGRCRPGFSGPALDLAAVVERARSLGFRKVGVAGFSMGAGAAFLAAAAGSQIDALVSIGCPPVFPDMAAWKRHPALSRVAARALGLRLDPRDDGGPSPMDVANEVGSMPKLLFFGEWEVFGEEEINRFVAALPGPLESVRVEGAWHADLGGREPEVRRWFERWI